MLNRKQLPAIVKFKIFPSLVSSLIQDLRDLGLFNTDLHTDINFGTSKDYREFLLASSHCYEEFFKNSDAPYLSGTAYRQKAFSRMPDALKGTQNQKIVQSSMTVRSRLRRINKESSDYVAEADELNYTELIEECPSSIKAIRDAFSSEGDVPTRVRLASVEPGYSLRPHMDHDPSHLCRFHIPVQTDVGALMGATGLNNEDHEVHLPVGGIYFLNTGRRHWVENKSDMWRIHLIVDVHGQNLLTKYLTAAEVLIE